MSTEHNPTRVENQWVWEDGTTLPVVSGGSDVSDAPGTAVGFAPADGPAEVTPEPDVEAPEPEEETAPEETPEVEEEVDPFEDEATDAFPRSYVQKLREEAAAHREKAKGYDETFSALHEDDAAWVLETTKLLASDPKAAAERFEQAAKALRGEEPTALEQAQDEAAAEGKVLSEADVRRIMAEEREQAEMQKAVVEARADIDKTLTELGYDDPQATPAKFVQYSALHDTGGDVKAAHAAFEKMIEERVQAVLTAKVQANGQHPPVATGKASNESKPLPKWGSKEWKNMVDGAA